jgi:glycosyltransferase involved in cell wall biosynthesis
MDHLFYRFKRSCTTSGAAPGIGMAMPPLPDHGTTLPPVVSVVVTCHNLAGWIGAALDSVLSQTALPRIGEIYVVDDGSSDHSREIIEHYAGRDGRIVPVFQANGGAGAARNAGIARASGALLAFLDGDDIWYPDKIAVQLDWAERHPDVVLFYSDFDWEVAGHRRTATVRALSPQTPDPLKEIFLKGVTILPSAALIRRDVLAETGPFDPTMPNLEDGELWTRIAHHHTLCHIQQALLCKRERAGNLTSHHSSREEGRRIISERVYALRPDLRRWHGHRDAYIAVQSGLAALETDKRKIARDCFLRAGIADIGCLKAWFYAAATLLPGNTLHRIDAAKRLLKALTGHAPAH